MTEPHQTIKFDSYRYLVLWAGQAPNAEAVEVRYGSTAADDPLDREVWQDWLRRHSIDPNVVAVPGWIRRNRQQYRVEYLAYATRADGSLAPLVDGEVVREERYVQLEGPPLQFPPIGPLTPNTITPETETP